eukprot:1924214-Rhodomonas_salina.4
MLTLPPYLSWQRHSSVSTMHSAKCMKDASNATEYHVVEDMHDAANGSARHCEHSVKLCQHRVVDPHNTARWVPDIALG